MNRIQAAFGRMEKQIKDRIDEGLTTQADVDEVCKALDMEFYEYARFQTLKSLAVADGSVTTEEGMTIYAALGEQPNTFNKQPVHIKVVLTNFFKELLDKVA